MNGMTDEKLLFWLTQSGVSPKKLNTLLDIYSPYELWDMVADEKIGRFLGERAVAQLKRFRNSTYIDDELDKIFSHGIKIITRFDDRFPLRLKQTEVCPPVILYYKGDISLLENEYAVAVVGTRVCSRYGRLMAERITEGLTQSGVTIVSGLATGIDAYAHAKCLESGGKAIAVIGGGLNHITPVQNFALSERIMSEGIILSEYHPDFAPTRYSFPERNRIVSALSLGVVVVEAGERSGALITANFALEQNREVFAVPGNVISSKSVGSNRLIKDGAILVESAADILSALKISQNKTEKQYLKLDFFEEKLYNLLTEGEKSFDELIQLSALKASEAGGVLTGLEIRGIVVKRGNCYALTQGD